MTKFILQNAYTFLKVETDMHLFAVSGKGT